MRIPSVRASLLLPILGVGLVLLGVCLRLLWQMSAQTTEIAGLTAAASVANEVATLRSFYTAEVATRAKAAGLALDYNWDHRERTLPLPATLVKALGENLAKDYPGSRVRLYSRYPFPHRRATERYDDFELAALEALEHDPDRPVHQMETLDGRLSVRYAVADRMRPACVSCHNSHPESPKTDWKVGDVRGVVEVVIPVDSVQADLHQGLSRTLTLIGLAFAVVLAAVLLVVRRVVLRPVDALRSGIAQVARGNLGVSFRRRANSDNELDLLGDDLQHLTGQLQEYVGASQELTTALEQGITRGVAQVQTSIASLTEGYALQGAAVAETLATLAELTHTATLGRERATQVLDQARRTQAVTHQGILAVESMVASMRSTHASVELTATAVHTLSARTVRVGEIVESVDEFSEQSRMLAMNASLEATRAGEAGRGFAVVAREVRSLADNSKQATQAIRGVLREIQAATGAAVRASGQGSQVVQQGLQLVETTQATIATLGGAMAEAGQSMEDITQSVSQHALGVEQIHQALRGIQRAVEDGVGSTEEIVASVAALQSQIASLSRLVRRFEATGEGAPTSGSPGPARGR